MEDRFPTNYSILLIGPPGVGKFEYLVDRIRDDLRRGERVVFVTLDLHPSEIRARAKALHFDLDAVEGKSLVFVDCYSATSSERPPESSAGKKTFVVSSFSNLEGIGMAMSKAGQEIGTPVRIYFYTVSTLFLHNSTQAIAKFFQIVTSRAKTNLGFILYAVHEGVHEPMTMNLLRSLVDGVVEMRFTEGVDPHLVVHALREAHLDDAVDEGPQEVHRHRLVDALVDRVQDEAEVRLRPGRDDLEELRDRLWGIVEEQGRHRVEVDADGRPDLLARLAHRHPDPFEVAEARDDEGLLSRARLRGSLRRRRAVAVDEHERLALDGIEVEVQRLRPGSDLARMEIQGHEDDALSTPQVVSDPVHEVLEFLDAGRAGQEDLM